VDNAHAILHYPNVIAVNQHIVAEIVCNGEGAMTTLIAIIGAGQCDRPTHDLAYQMGAQLAQQGYTLICGGLGGVMAAACEGAKQYHGSTIGILPGDTPNAAKLWVDIAIPTGMGEARNFIIVRSAAALIAIGGEYGTLSEIAIALKLGKPLVGLNTWQPIRPGGTQPDFPWVETASQAVDWIKQQLFCVKSRL
jgi:uncharacterized protein (TIGR00725 family)